jgi:hypothetical protein
MIASVISNDPQISPNRGFLLNYSGSKSPVRIDAYPPPFSTTVASQPG